MYMEFKCSGSAEKNTPIADCNFLSGKEVKLNLAKTHSSTTVNSKT